MKLSTYINYQTFFINNQGKFTDSPERLFWEGLTLNMRQSIKQSLFIEMHLRLVEEKNWGLLHDYSAKEVLGIDVDKKMTDEELTQWIKAIRGLRYLNLRHEQLTDLGILSHFPNIERLTCSDNQLLSLDGIKQLASLRVLFCINNQLKDLNPLAELKQLSELYCAKNEIENLSPLYELSSLKLVNCRNNRLKKEMISAFKSAKPACQFKWRRSWL